MKRFVLTLVAMAGAPAAAQSATGEALVVRMLVRQRDSAKPWAPVRPGLVGEYKAELQGQWQSLP